jgi:hypothetical protein
MARNTDCKVKEVLKHDEGALQPVENLRIRRIEDKIFQVSNGWMNGIPAKTFAAKDAFKTSETNPLNNKSHHSVS